MMGYGHCLGFVLALVIAGAAIYAASRLPPEDFFGGETGRLAFYAVAGVFAIASFYIGRTSLADIRDRIPIDQWETFSRISMHQRVSAVVAFLIKKFIMLRDVGRPTR
jgi:hypothetical protein